MRGMKNGYVQITVVSSLDTTVIPWGDEKTVVSSLDTTVIFTVVSSLEMKNGYVGAMVR
jgi:hypothetical protein